ncbi:MAG: glycoside hydrolase family 88 protein, partial [Actinomycetota bacterium]|nr:glycoside hydrolase family 88 protein [Actinomycetota bacterium]
AYERQLAWLREGAPRAHDGTLFHIEGTRSVWVDTVYMVVPLLALAGRLDEALAQLDGHRQRLFDETTGLYAHKWDEDTGTLERADHWGSGSGWVVAGIARALRHVPTHEAGVRHELAEHARVVIDACLSHRRPDGIFHDVVDDPGTFPEANLAQMLAFAVLSGAHDGWLSPGYADVGRSLVEAAAARLDDDGRVTPVCGAPHFDRPGTSVEAQAFFLLATAAEQRIGPASLA